METIIELGHRGADQIEVVTPNGQAEDEALRGMLHLLRKLPHANIQAETEDGIQRTLDVRLMPLDNPGVFKLARRLVAYEPIVYARNSYNPATMGMLSANYDSTGSEPLDSLRLIPLVKPQPLTSRLQPMAASAIMLAGAVSAERAGVGSHESGAARDFEHQATILGALSLGQPSVALSHQNHQVRRNGQAIASSLTDGTLGTIYQSSRLVDDFDGYGQPITIAPERVAAGDMLMIPDSFLDRDDAWGGSYRDASRIMLGAGLQTLHERHGALTMQSQFRDLAERL